MPYIFECTRVRFMCALKYHRYIPSVMNFILLCLLSSAILCLAGHPFAFFWLFPLCRIPLVIHFFFVAVTFYYVIFILCPSSSACIAFWLLDKRKCFVLKQTQEYVCLLVECLNCKSVTKIWC